MVENEVSEEALKLQFLKCPPEAECRNSRGHIHTHVKMKIFTAEINIFTAWSKIQFGSEKITSFRAHRTGDEFVLKLVCSGLKTDAYHV